MEQLYNKEEIFQFFHNNGTVKEAVIKYPNLSKRTLYLYRKDALSVQNTFAQNESIANSNAIGVAWNTSDDAKELTVTDKMQNIAQRACIALVLLLLSANFFTIQEVSSKVFSIAPVTGWCIAIAITLTPVAVIFTKGNMILRVCIQLIAFCIEVICNVVVVSESNAEGLKGNIANATGLSELGFAWIAGISVPLFALLCNVYLNQLQQEKESFQA